MRHPNIPEQDDYDFEDMQIGEWLFWDEDLSLNEAWILETELEACCCLAAGNRIWRMNRRVVTASNTLRWTLLRRGLKPKAYA